MKQDDATKEDSRNIEIAINKKNEIKGGTMTKLKDIELSALEEDIIASNLTHVVLTKVADELASNYVAEHDDELKKTIRIDDNSLRELVLNKLADRIIGRFMGELFS